MVNNKIIGFEDEAHKNIRLAMEKLGDKIKVLQRQPEYEEALRQRIAKLRFGYTDLNEDEKKTIDAQVKECKDRIEELLTSEELKEKIESIRIEIAKLDAEYYETPYKLPPLYLKSRTQYEDNNGTLIKALADDLTGKKLFLYEGSDYVTPNVKILVDELNRPLHITRKICNSDTLGKVLTFEQDVLVDVEPPKPEKPKPKPQPRKEVMYWNCKCGNKNYHELRQCLLCHSPKPKENLEENNRVSTESKGLFAKIKEKL